MFYFSRLVVFVSCLLVSYSYAQQLTTEITADDIRTHVKYLASDDLQGRGSGTEGNRKAAVYIADLLQKWGINPAGDNGTYFQPFQFVSAVKMGPSNALAIESEHAGGTRTEFTTDVDFRPLSFTSNAEVSGQIVFAGYGISAPDDNYDDYKDIDVVGKVVVVMRYGPEGDSPRSQFYKYTLPRFKARAAREKGAIAMILITGPVDGKDDDLLKLSFDQVAENSGIPAISMKRSLLLPYLTSMQKDLKTIQDSIKARRKPESFAISNARLTLRTDVVKIFSKTANVLGTIEGSDPAFKDQVLVLGAHLDHLGLGGPGSGSMMPDTIAIHNGADDNASGTAALLELAQKFAAERGELKRSLVFTFFSGEELGTLGSSYYVNHPPFPLSQSIAMLNLDMVGRIENRTLTVGGTGTSPQWNALLAKYNSDSSFVLKLNPEGFGPSDHASFYGKDLPVLFFFTGTHDDYHKPSDDWEKLNYPGEEKIVRYVYKLVREIDLQVEKPVFARVQSSSPQGAGDGRGFSVSLRIVPDFGESTQGMKISAVRPNGPGEKAGMKAGDVVVKMAGKKVLNIYDYMAILQELKAGDEVEVEVLRGETHMTFHAKMEKQK